MGGERGRRARRIRFSWLLIVAGILLLAVPAGAYFITIDDIGDKGVGDKFTIMASTDLPEGRVVIYTVQSSSFAPTQKTQSGEFNGLGGSTVVTAGGGSPNRIFFDVDTGGWQPGVYAVAITSLDQRVVALPVQSVTANALFNLISISQPYINVNPIGDRYLGERFTVTATTNLPPGEEILFTVAPTPFSVDDRNKGGEFSGLRGTAFVMAGARGINHISFQVDTSTSRPGDHAVLLEDRRLDRIWNTNFNVLPRITIPTTTPTPETVPPTTNIPTTTANGDDLRALLLAVLIVGAFAGSVAVGLKVLGGRVAPEVHPGVRLEVQRGMKVEGMSREKTGIRLDVEGGIKTPDETMKGGSG